MSEEMKAIATEQDYKKRDKRLDCITKMLSMFTAFEIESVYEIVRKKFVSMPPTHEIKE